MMHDCHICTLCYEIIVNEFQLIEVERNFALAQHIPISNEEINFILYGSKQKIEYVRPPLLPTKMIQWRLFIYFDRIEVL